MQAGHPRGRRGLSLIEALIAASILGVLGVTVQSLMVNTLRGVRVDRLTEAQRHLTLDLLERFCHPYSPIAAIFPAGDEPIKSRVLTVDEVLDVVQIPEDQRATLRSILKAGLVTGFNLTWQRAKERSAGDPGRAMVLNVLWVFPVTSTRTPGPRSDSFRVSYARGMS